MKIEEVNAITRESEDDMLFVSSLDAHALVTNDDSDMTTWIFDSGASFHVIPHREWFCSYNGGSQLCMLYCRDWRCETCIF